MNLRVIGCKQFNFYKFTSFLHIYMCVCVYTFFTTMTLIYGDQVVQIDSSTRSCSRLKYFYLLSVKLKTTTTTGNFTDVDRDIGESIPILHQPNSALLFMHDERKHMTRFSHSRCLHGLSAAVRSLCALSGDRSSRKH